jgi:predicted MPP superfamily phosphohydrolase
MIRAIRLTVLLLSAGEVLLLHWAALTVRGRGLSLSQALLGMAALAAFNFAVLPWVRARIRATGVQMVLSRTWLLGSVAALLTGLLLAAVFVLVGGGASIAGFESAGRLALGWSGGVTIALGFGSVLWGASVGSYRVRVDRVDLPARGLSVRHGKLRIAHVTDLHIGPLLRPPKLREFVDRINRLEADLVVITGDIFDFDPEAVEAGCRELARLEAPHGVYAVLGNHDVYTGAEVVADGIERHTSIRLLRDEWESIDIAGAPLAIAGIEDSGDGWTERESESPVLERLAREIPEDLPSLLLAHRPSFFAAAARLGFSVVLSGHTHGGQVAFPVVHHYNPSRLIAHRTRGVYRSGRSTLYVSRGLGMAGLPLRLNCPREIALIRLTSEEPRYASVPLPSRWARSGDTSTARPDVQAAVDTAGEPSRRPAAAAQRRSR